MEAQTQPVADAAKQYGSDAIVGLLADLGVEYAAFNPGATFRGLHESLLSQPGAPTIVPCAHEEISVAVAHGYAKAAGRPMVSVLHNVVGLQHACMAIYNAWCDRVPILLLGATGPVDADQRRPWIDWIHTALVQGNHVRDFVKWDDQPTSVPAAIEAVRRGHRLAVSAPTAPTYVCLPVEVQEQALDAPIVLSPQARFQPGRSGPDPAAIEDAARLLVGASAPVIVADRAGTAPGAVTSLARLAHIVGAALIDKGGRMNVSTENPLDLTGSSSALAEADVVLAVDVYDISGSLRLVRSPEARVISISLADSLLTSWTADYQALVPVDVPISADTELALEALVDACGGVHARSSAEAIQQRRERHGDEHARLRAGWQADARSAWDESPISLARLAAEVWRALDGRPWVLAHGTLNGWARRLWSWTEPRSYLGGSGGGGIGYGPGAAIGAALANRGNGKVIVNLQPDGDLLYTPSALWTMAHEQLPIVNVIWNNRSYYNSEEHVVEIARSRDRHDGRPMDGVRIDSPNVDFSSLGRTFGLHAEGPVTEPYELGPALARAVDAALGGQPALVDVLAASR